MNERFPESVLVVGCGLIGTSLARAISSRLPDITITGVEIRPDYRGIAAECGAFASIDADVPRASRFDLAVLATPVDVACRQLPAVAAVADVVLDVCSVKRDICQVAERFNLRDAFAPTHPMAGLSTPGPTHATPDLFAGRTWITIAGWPACRRVYPLLETLGARVVELPTPDLHDAAMASVSHGIHLASLTALLASDALATDRQGGWAELTGPAFRDVTRLAESPTQFWRSTLLANRDHVLSYISALQTVLGDIAAALTAADGDSIEQWLARAQSVYKKWKEERL
jgi:prephenate dehydrogenase